MLTELLFHPLHLLNELIWTFNKIIRGEALGGEKRTPKTNKTHSLFIDAVESSTAVISPRTLKEQAQLKRSDLTNVPLCVWSFSRACSCYFCRCCCCCCKEIRLVPIYAIWHICIALLIISGQCIVVHWGVAKCPCWDFQGKVCVEGEAKTVWRRALGMTMIPMPSANQQVMLRQHFKIHWSERSPTFNVWRKSFRI